MKRNPPTNVYVVELAPGAAKKHRDVQIVTSGGRIVYVGQSALSPTARLEHHKAGGVHASSVVQRWGTRILWWWGPFSDRDRGEQAERLVAKALRKRGLAVLGGH